MTGRVRDAYIVSAVRTPVGRAPRGNFRHVRPDDLLVHALRGALAAVPEVEPADIHDAVIGCAMPEAEQGLNVARMGVLLAGLPASVAGVTVNRFCASGLEALALAADRIRLGEAEVMLAGGTESMSAIPMMGHRPLLNPACFDADGNRAIAYGMGLTAERVARRWNVSRADQDAFALESHTRALGAMRDGAFAEEILPYEVCVQLPSDAGPMPVVRRSTVSDDEGPRPGTSMESLAALRPVFAADGSVTAGNSSQMSDGAGAALLMSEDMVRALGIEPLARFVGYTVAGVEPEFMGIGPVEAVPALLRRLGMQDSELDWIELNEAFAAQSLAVIRELDLDPQRVNPLGGAIALGHPLGATGAIRTATLVHGLRRRRQRYGMITMCVGTGMGAAAVIEAL